MSREDELFDDFLRSKFESKEFTNKPHYWQNAQEMIAQGRKNNTSFRPIIVGSIVLLSVLSFGLLFKSKYPVQQSKTNTLTASSVSVGTSTTSTYDLNTTPVNTVSETGSGVDGQPLMNSSSAPVVSSNPKTNNTVNPENEEARVSEPRKPKRNKNNRNKGNSVEQTDQTPVQNQSPQVIDINGKTLTAPFNTSTPSPAYNKTNAYIQYASKSQKSFIAIEAGVNGYNIGNNFVNSIGGQIGVRYYRFVSSKIGLSAGLTYARLHQNLPDRSFEYTNYDFGKNASALIVTTQRLDYIELPVSVLYQLAPKHSLTAGVSLGYVIQSSDKVIDETGKQTQQNGYLSGINRWDTQFNLGYQYNLSQQLWIRTSYHMGIMDISDNTLFKQATTDTNKGLRLTLGYKVF